MPYETLRESKPKNYGYKPSEIVEGEHWILGGATTRIKGQVLNPSGEWASFLPDKEPQSKNGYDTFACVSFATNNAYETLLNFLKSTRDNFSDRYLAVVSGTTPGEGNNPHQVAESFRKNGAIDENLLPFSDDIDSDAKFFSPKPMNQILLDKGKMLLDVWEPGHEWAWSNVSWLASDADKPKLLAEALTRGPVCISVYAWWFDSTKNMYIRPRGAQDNHWTQLVEIQSDGSYLIFDSYDGYLKTLAPDFNFGVAKIYYLTPTQEKLTIFAKILDLIGKILGIEALLIKNRAVLPPNPSPESTSTPPSPSIPPSTQFAPKIAVWAEAIKQQEGWSVNPPSRSCRNNNPGNMKFRPLQKSLGATGHDAENFAIFPDYQTGFNALCSFLVLACNDELKDYHNARTLLEFTRKYANPPDDMYAYHVADALGIKVDDRIKILLT